MGQTVSQALKWGIEKLKERGIEEPRLDAEVLLAHILETGRTQLYINIGAELTGAQSDRYRLLIERRGLREPVSYLTGTREFMSLDFKVRPGVLIPRPETELIVEKIMALKPRLVVDVGVGSGAIAVSVANYLVEAKVIAVDVSMEALEVARENAVRLGLAERIQFLHGDLLEPVIGFKAGPVDLVAANLPYIPTGVMEQLPDDVRLYEPALALDGGEQGLSLYKRLIEQAPRVLKPGGALLMEIGYNQGCLLKDYLKAKACFENVEILKDLAGKDRVVLVNLK